MAPINAELLPNGNILVLGIHSDIGAPILGGRGILREYTIEGRKVWEYCRHNMHHDFARLANGNTMILGRELMPPDIAEKMRGGVKPGELNNKMMGDFFAEVTPDGDIVWDWHVCKHIDFEEDTICPMCTRGYGLQVNSCEILSNGDLLTTFRQTNTVAIIDRKKEEFRWKWGADVLGHPHDPSILPNGNILLFDNGMHIIPMPRSRIIEVNPRKPMIIWDYHSESLVDFFSQFGGSAQRLWNGNTLICQTNIGRIFEATRDGDVVWEFYNPQYCLDKTLHNQMGMVLHNWVYRARRYTADHPAFDGLKLPSPG